MTMSAAMPAARPSASCQALVRLPRRDGCSSGADLALEERLGAAQVAARQKRRPGSSDGSRILRARALDMAMAHPRMVFQQRQAGRWRSLATGFPNETELKWYRLGRLTLALLGAPVQTAP